MLLFLKDIFDRLKEFLVTPFLPFLLVFYRCHSIVLQLRAEITYGSYLYLCIHNVLFFMFINTLFSSLQWASSPLNAQVEARQPRVSAGVSRLPGTDWASAKEGAPSFQSQAPLRGPEPRVDQWPDTGCCFLLTAGHPAGHVFNIISFQWCRGNSY